MFFSMDLEKAIVCYQENIELVKLCKRKCDLRKICDAVFYTSKKQVMVSVSFELFFLTISLLLLLKKRSSLGGFDL